MFLIILIFHLLLLFYGNRSVNLFIYSIYLQAGIYACMAVKKIFLIIYGYGKEAVFEWLNICSKTQEEVNQNENQRDSNIEVMTEERLRDEVDILRSEARRYKREIEEMKITYNNQFIEMELEILKKRELLEEIELENQRARALQKLILVKNQNQKTLYAREMVRMNQEMAERRKSLEAIERENKQAQELQRWYTEENQKRKVAYEKDMNCMNSEMAHKKKLIEEIVQKNQHVKEMQNKNMEAHLKMKALHEKRIEELNAEIADKTKLLEEIESKIQKAEESHKNKIAHMGKEHNTKVRSEEKSEKAEVVHRWLIDRQKKKTVIELILKDSLDQFKCSNQFNKIELVPCLDSEYRSVKSRFMMTTQPHFNIKSILKVIHPSAMVDYMLKKKQFQLLHDKNNVTEKLLFRGISNVNSKNLSTSIYEFQNHWIKKQGFPSNYWGFTDVSNHANRRCNSTVEKYMILATVLICKCSGTKDSHNELCNYEADLKTDQNGRPKRTYFKFNKDEFYPTYWIKFTGNTLNRSMNPGPIDFY